MATSISKDYEVGNPFIQSRSPHHTLLKLRQGLPEIKLTALLSSAKIGIEKL
jgi:hypothetical protein